MGAALSAIPILVKKLCRKHQIARDGPYENPVTIKKIKYGKWGREWCEEGNEMTLSLETRKKIKEK